MSRVTIKSYPRIMIRELQAGIIKALNNFTRKDGISTTMSPGTIVDGREKPRLNIKKISFGSFAYVFNDTDNTMDKRVITAIVLRQSKDNRGHYFMSLETVKKINCNIWT